MATGIYTYQCRKVMNLGYQFLLMSLFFNHKHKVLWPCALSLPKLILVSRTSYGECVDIILILAQ